MGEGEKGRLAGRSARGQWSALDSALGRVALGRGVDCIQRILPLPSWAVDGVGTPAVCVPAPQVLLLLSALALSLSHLSVLELVHWWYNPGITSSRFSILFFSFWQTAALSLTSLISPLSFSFRGKLPQGWGGGRGVVRRPCSASRRTAALFIAARRWFSSPRYQHLRHRLSLRGVLGCQAQANGTQVFLTVPDMLKLQVEQLGLNNSVWENENFLHLSL